MGPVARRLVRAVIVVAAYGPAAFLPARADEAAASAMAAGPGVDASFLLLCAAIVFFMQPGFLLLEAGLVRSKNSINVAQKNLVDFLISTLTFGLCGAALMFGDSFGFAGWRGDLALWSATDDKTLIFLFFQAMFCGAAATIVSGAVAERFGYAAYLAISVAMAAVIYPVSGHWVWGAGLEPTQSPWLAGLGFIDFAGSGVVHLVGAAAALVAVLMVGPREGRFADGKVLRIYGHSALLATVGGLMLFFGWFGFNIGSALTPTGPVGLVAINTLYAGCAGGLTGMVVGRLQRPVWRPEHVVNGMLAGLVAVTAGCASVTPAGAVALGAAGAIVAHYGARFLCNIGVDDAVGAIAVHGGAGITGLLGLALAAPASALAAGGRLEQFLVQGLGALALAGWAAAATWATLAVASCFVKLRVPAEHEKIGLNVAEHDETLGVGKLQDHLVELAAGRGDLGSRIDTEPGEESAAIAGAFNMLMAKLEADEIAARTRSEIARAAEAEALERARREQENERALASRIARAVSEVEEGRLDGRVPLDGAVGALHETASGLNRLIAHMGGLVAAIDASAREVKDLAAAQSDGARNVARDTRDQNDAMDFIRAELDVLTDHSRVIGATAMRAMDMTVAAADATRTGRTAASQAAAAVAAMLDNARRAKAAVEAIEMIAFQTNMLSINAAVEAARAGSSGASFRIISDDIRQLSAQTKRLADDIGSILLGSLDGVESSAREIGRTTTELDAICAQTAEVRDSVTEIARSATMQADQCGELLSAVERIGGSVDSARRQAEESLGLSLRVAERADALAGEVAMYVVPENLPAAGLATSGDGGVTREARRRAVG